MPSLEFTLMVGCPLKCTFCPQDNLKTAYGKNAKYLSLADFQTILDKVPLHVRIDFAGMAEPWANEWATPMLGIALAKGYNVAIYTTLYGMSEEDGRVVARYLVDHAPQIEVLCLHLPDVNGNMRGWKYSPEYERNLMRFMGLWGILPRFEAMTMDGSGRVHSDLAHMNIQLGAWEGHTRAGNVKKEDVRGQSIAATPEHDTAVLCSFTPFYDQNVVLPNGDVALCCMDYSAKHVIGNLLQQSYYDIFMGAPLAQIRADNMKIGKGGTLCKTCDRATPLRVGPAKQFWKG